MVIFQEDLRIALVRIYNAGRRNGTLFALIEKNVRVPIKVFGDLRAQLSACHVAEPRFLELVSRHGAETVDNRMTELIDFSERLTRAALRELPDGAFRFEDWIDEDGVNLDEPIRLCVEFTKKGDHLVADWSGSGPGRRRARARRNADSGAPGAGLYACRRRTGRSGSRYRSPRNHGGPRW